MDELERFIDEIDKLDEEIKKKEARAVSFIDPLADELMTIALLFSALGHPREFLLYCKFRLALHPFSKDLISYV